MRPEIWAVLTACCWGFGSLLEKQGVKLGNLTPVMGTTIRTVFSLLLLLGLSSPFWGQVRSAGAKSILLIAVGGGVLAGGLGIVCLYSGLKSGNLTTVMAVAFSLTPVVGAILGHAVLRERLTWPQGVGVLLCVTGVLMVTWFKQG